MFFGAGAPSPRFFVAARTLNDSTHHVRRSLAKTDVDSAETNQRTPTHASRVVASATHAAESAYNTTPTFWPLFVGRFCEPAIYLTENANLTIVNDVVVQGGGTFRFGGFGTMTINAFSTLRIEPHTTFDYACMTRYSLVMSLSSSTLYLDNCTLKAQEMEGLELITGKVVVDGEVILDNGVNTVKANGIRLGSEATALNMVFKSGSRFKTLGMLWYNRP